MPEPTLELVQVQQFCNLFTGQGTGEVLLVGEDEDGGVAEAVVGQDGGQLVTGLVEALPGERKRTL